MGMLLLRAGTDASEISFIGDIKYNDGKYHKVLWESFISGNKMFLRGGN